MTGLIQLQVTTGAGNHWLIPVMTDPLQMWGPMWMVKFGGYQQERIGGGVGCLTRGAWNWNQETGVLRPMSSVPQRSLMSTCHPSSTCASG